MKDKEIVYWKQRNGELISVEDMDINHLRNAFKYLIKHNTNVVKQANEIVDKYNDLVRKKKAERSSTSFKLNGDMSNFFNEEQNNSFQNDWYESNLDVDMTDIETSIL